MQTQLGVNSSLWCLSLVLGQGEGALSSAETSCPAFQKIWGSRELFMHLLILGCLQLKITLMPTWPIWGCHMIAVSFKQCEWGLVGCTFISCHFWLLRKWRVFLVLRNPYSVILSGWSASPNSRCFEVKSTLFLSPGGQETVINTDALTRILYLGLVIWRKKSFIIWLPDI